MSSTTSAAEGWRKSSHSNLNGSCVEWRFRKSSHSTNNGQCLEAAFRKSSYSNYNGSCTEAALQDGIVLVRDSKLVQPDGSYEGPILKFTPAAWAAFTTSIKESQ